MSHQDWLELPDWIEFLGHGSSLLFLRSLCIGGHSSGCYVSHQSQMEQEPDSSTTWTEGQTARAELGPHLLTQIDFNLSMDK